MSRFRTIGIQYFDDAGAPVVEGKLWFFQPGTDTLKDTFADVNLTVNNENPVELSAAGRQPNIFFTGSARVILTHRSGQIEVRDPVGGDTADGSFIPWNADQIFNVPDIVVGSDNNFYISITDNNEGNDPVSSPTDWTQVRFIRVWNVNETYTLHQIVEGSDGLLYTSQSATNTGNDPVTDLINWNPATQASIPAVIRAAGKTFAYRNF